ncbi:hypothetical protein M885DRAFT_611403 [Pelagophyceae sp. CCMP2097]|nr:hypothetical protein M885DRAFT_611403 [Pelagophyceae sp. CCMP2097]
MGDDSDSHGTVDADVLKREQALGAMQTELHRLFGFDGGAVGLVQLDVSALHRFLGDVGEKLSDHDKLLIQPPWLQHLQKKQSALEKQVAEMGGELASMRLEVQRARDAAENAQSNAPSNRQAAPEGGPRRTDELESHVQGAEDNGAVAEGGAEGGHAAAPAAAPAEDDGARASPGEAPEGAGRPSFDYVSRDEVASRLRQLRQDCVPRAELERRLASVLDSAARADGVARLDVKAQLVSFSIDLERMRKTVDVAPSMIEVEALKELYGGKLKAFKVLVLERVAKAERDARLDASADVLRLEDEVHASNALAAGTIEALQASALQLQDEVLLVGDETRKAAGRLEGKMDEAQAGLERRVSAVRQEVQAQTDRLCEVHATSAALDSSLSAMSLRSSETAAMVGEEGSRNRKVLAETKAEISFLKSLIDGNTQQYKHMKDGSQELDSKMDGLESTLADVSKNATLHSDKIGAVEDRASKLDELMPSFKAADAATDANLEAFKVESCKSSAACKSHLANLQADQVAQQARVGKVEHEVYHVLPPKLSELDLTLGVLRDAHAQQKNAQDDWNERTLAQAHEADQRAFADAEAARATGQAHALAISGLESKAEAAALSSAATADHVRSLERAVAANHGAVSAAVRALTTDSEARFDLGEAQLPLEISKLRSHVKSLFDSMEEELTSKIKHSHNSPIHLTAADQKEYLRHQAQELAKLDIRFEQQAHDKGKPAKELPRDVCRAISLVTQEMAEYIAQKADVWAVEQHIHGAAEDHPYADNTVEARRQRIAENFMDLLAEEVERRHPDAGAVRMDARRKINAKIRGALEMSLSKMDQVMVVGNSRLLTRQLHVPKCVTCDRPLHNAHNAYKDVAARASTIVEHLSRPESSAAFPRPLTELGLRATTASAAALRGQSGSQLYATQVRHQVDITDRLNTSEGSRSAQIKANTIMRGGFRMPKAGLSPEIQSMMEPNRIQAQRQLDVERDSDDIALSTQSLSALPGLRQ